MHNGMSRRRCPSDGELRALLDLEGDERLRQHLGDCGRCERRLQELRVAKQVTDKALTAYAAVVNDVDVSAAMARVVVRSRSIDWQAAAEGGSLEGRR